MTEKKLSIRLAALDGKKVEDTFNRIGKTGERAFDKISRSTKPANSNLKAVDATARALNGVFRQAVGLVAAYAGIAGVMRGVGFIVSTNREFERLTASLKTVTGSAEGAADAFAMIERFALNTPFNVENITDSFIRLKSIGIDASSESLEAIGNIASLMGADITQAANAVTRAVTGEFDALKSFGIVARTEGEKVRFIFQGTETVVRKTQKEIANFLITIGQNQAAGAMAEQMDTLNGIISNVQDNMGRLARSVGQGGLTDALKDVASDLKQVTDSGDDVARSLGESLAGVVRVGADILGFLASNADVAATAIGGLVVARVASAAFAGLNATIAASETIALLRSVAQVSTGVAVQFAIMEGATKLATVAMVGFRTALAFVGGPVGLAVLAGFALVNLASGHDAAAKAAKDHSTELDKLRKMAEKAKKGVEDLDKASRNEQLFRLEEQKRLAQENISAITEQLKLGEIGGFFDQFKRFGKPLQFELHAIRHEFLNSRLSADEYSNALFKLARKYPSFGEQAKDIKEQVLALKAAELAAKNASLALDKLNNPKKDAKTTNSLPDEAPTLTSQQIERITKRIAELEAEEIALNRVVEARKNGGNALKEALLLNEQEQTLRKLGLSLSEKEGSQQRELADQLKAKTAEIFKLQAQEKALQEEERKGLALEKERVKTVEDVRKRFMDLDGTLQTAISRAVEWKQEALQGLDKTAEGYSEFSEHVEAIFNDMINEAREKDLQASKRWQDGTIRALRTVAGEAGDAASQMENLVTNAFSNMENALVDFVRTGKLDFKSLTDSIISDLVRMQIQSSITGPLSMALSSFAGGLFGGGAAAGATTTAPAFAPEATVTAFAHTGGVIGADSLATGKVNPAVFNGAPKFHTGGIVADEVPIIAKRGEAVFTPGQLNALGGAINSQPEVKLNVNIQNSANAQVRTESNRGSGGEINLQVIIEEIEGKMARNVSRGEGLAPTLEHRYGLNPAAGSYR